MQFSKNLSLLRKKMGLSQDELAYAVGVSRQTIYTWEAGLNYPNIVMLKNLANVLEVTADELLNGFEVNKLLKTVSDIKLEYVSKHNGEVLYEELPNWFIRLKPESEVSWALYDLKKGSLARDYSYHIESLGYAVIHEIEGLEIEVKEYDPELNFTRKYNQFISVKDNGVAWIGEVTYNGDKKIIKTYKDQDFLNDWGYDKKLIYQAMNYLEAEDYILEYNGKKQNVIKISYFDPDGSDDMKNAYFEVFLNSNFESLVWRRYTKIKNKKNLSGERVIIDNEMYDMDYYSLTSRL